MAHPLVLQIFIIFDFVSRFDYAGGLVDSRCSGVGAQLYAIIICFKFSYKLWCFIQNAH